MKDQLGDAPPTIGSIRRLGAKGWLITCGLPCRRQARLPFEALRLPDEAGFDPEAARARFTCSTCGRRPATVSVDWGMTAARAIDPRS